MSDRSLYPFLKWAGGKRQLLHIINENLPSEIYNSKIDRYIEPFVGGGAVLFDLIQKFKFKEIIINDYNEDLICLYKHIRDNVDFLIKEIYRVSEEYLKLDNDSRVEYFYFIRNLYNTTSKGTIDKSAYLIFLNKTCFNGLYRVNSRGLFNVPHGRYKNPTILDENNLRTVSGVLQNVNIKHGDFSSTIDFVDEKTFVYFDPPYRPLNNTSSFTSYSKNEFDDNEQIRLADFFDKLNRKKAKLLLSNSDPKNIDESDNFFDELYSEYNIMRVEAKRVINSKSNGRGLITELLIKNY